MYSKAESQSSTVSLEYPSGDIELWLVVCRNVVKNRSILKSGTVTLQSQTGVQQSVRLCHLLSFRFLSLQFIFTAMAQGQHGPVWEEQWCSSCHNLWSCIKCCEQE